VPQSPPRILAHGSSTYRQRRLSRLRTVRKMQNSATET
jgi:hypothetical protein